MKSSQEQKRKFESQGGEKDELREMLLIKRRKMGPEMLLDLAS